MQALGVKLKRIPRCQRQGLGHLSDSSFDLEVPYTLQVDCLNVTIHEHSTDSPQSRGWAGVGVGARRHLDLPASQKRTTLKFLSFLSFFFFKPKNPTSADVKHGPQTQHPIEAKVRSLGGWGQTRHSGDLHKPPGNSTTKEKEQN